MSEFIQDLKVVAFQNKAHWLLLEATEQVNSEVLAFLDGKGDDEPSAEPVPPGRL